MGLLRLRRCKLLSCIGQKNSVTLCYVGVTSHVTDAELCLVQVERLVNSHTLHGSESLCKLLRYLADQALKHPGVALKEYQIATEVFGRPADFDPHLDSLIRVQAGRLRSKLSEYYLSDGAEDPIVVELPKGTYTVAFHHPSAPPKTTLNGPREIEQVGRAVEPSKHSRMVIALSVLLAVAIVVIAGLLLTRNPNASGAASAGERVPAAFRVFWQPFTAGPEEPWVIFSNGAFVGRPYTGMRYYNRARDSGTMILDHYTGVGEVLAVHALDNVFATLHQQIRVKRGSLFSLDDAKNNDLIFIGSPSENLTLLELPNTQEFTFKQITSGPRTGTMEIINSHPESGEPKEFLPSPPDETLTEDYSVIALKRGLNPAHSVLILAGATTIGTQAAVEYVCQQDSIEQLLLRLSVSNSGELKPFEAVIRVKVARGVPVGSELVALRKVAQ